MYAVIFILSLYLSFFGSNSQLFICYFLNTGKQQKEESDWEEDKEEEEGY